MTIVGYTWEEIQAAQQGGRLARALPATPTRQAATEADRQLLQQRAEHGLRKQGLWGVLDRCQQAGLVVPPPRVEAKQDDSRPRGEGVQRNVIGAALLAITDSEADGPRLAASHLSPRDSHALYLLADPRTRA